MATHAGPRAEWWFGKHTSKAPGTEAGTDARGRYGKVSNTHRWFSYDWWFGHHMGRKWDGEFAEHGAPTKRPRFVKTAKQRQQDARREYAAYLNERYHAAERATNGYMVSKAGKAKGYSGSDFFDPNASRRPSLKWATDELRAWFGHGSAAAGTKGHRGASGGRLLSFTAWQEQTRERAA